AHGLGAERRQVAAGVRLAVALAPDFVGAHDVGEVALLLRLVAIGNQRRAEQRQPQDVDQRRRALAGHLFDEDSLLDERRAAPAVLFRPVNADPAGLVHLLLPRAQEVEALARALAAPVFVFPAGGRVARQPGAELVAELLL